MAIASALDIQLVELQDLARLLRGVATSISQQASKSPPILCPRAGAGWPYQQAGKMHVK